MAQALGFGFVLVNVGLPFPALNPWIVRWQGEALLVLFVEVALIPLLVVPVVAFQMLVRTRTFRESLSVAVSVLGDMLAGIS